MQQQLILTLAMSLTLVLADIKVTIDEEVPLGTEVTRLTDYRSVYPNLTSGGNWLMTYDILNQNNPPANYFRIDPGTGIITVAKRMDRETICDPVVTCSVSGVASSSF